MVAIVNAKKQSVGSTVKDLDVIVTTAGQVKQVDESLPKKQSKQNWEQKLGLTDNTGHIWAIASVTAGDSFKPIVKRQNMIIKEATVDEFTTKGGVQEKRLLISKYEILTFSEPPEGEGFGEKPKLEGILDPLVEKILEKYDITATEALWPCTRKHKGVAKTNWVIYHRYCEQIAAKAGIVFNDPKVVVNEVNDKGKRTVVLLVKGRLGHVTEWSYGEASPDTTFLPYVFAMAEKRGKDRVILKLAGFHGMVYSDVEEEWKNNK